MRAYGREHLQWQEISDTIRGRHARYMGPTVWSVQQRTLGPEELQPTERLDEYLPDGLVALDWCIDHHEWEQARRLTWVGNDASARKSIEMQSRLHDAARAGGAPAHLLDELARMDFRQSWIISASDLSRKLWETIRTQAPIPSNRFVTPPYGDVVVVAEEIDEFVASLDHWRSGPAFTRFWALHRLGNDLLANRFATECRRTGESRFS